MKNKGDEKKSLYTMITQAAWVAVGCGILFLMYKVVTELI
ncbi:hypothetical protein QOZ91_001892 [Clostridium sardiniense]|nr:hypothetical protein [Clostridium sardiniense]